MELSEHALEKPVKKNRQTAKSSVLRPLMRCQSYDGHVM